jgi:hypothetical protein
MTAQEAVAFLAGKRRAVLLGGMAMILHGLSRSTKDYDIWLDPIPGPEAWAKEIKELMSVEPVLGAQRIDPVLSGNWLPIGKEDIGGVGAEDGLVRLACIDRPIDVFYLPNELAISDFEGVWQRSTPIEHGLRLIEKIDLIVTKQLTDRAVDRTDVAYLSGRITEEYEGRLINCSEEEARELFARFATPEIAAFACRESQNTKVRELGWRTLEEMRTAGDPFAADLIAELQAGRDDLAKPSDSFWHERARAERTEEKDRGPELDR